MAAVVELLTDAAFALSPLAAYLPQYFTIRRTKSDGFSPLVCFVLLVAHTLRAVYWLGRRFKLALLVQSFVVIGVQLLLLHAIVSVKRGKAKDLKVNVFDRTQFWQWPRFEPYLAWYSLFTLLVLLAFGAFRFSPFMVETIGTLGCAFEASLAVPQIVKNFRTKATTGLSLTMVLCWLGGDLAKLGFLIAHETPWAFVASGVAQVATDAVVLLQILVMYPKKAGFDDSEHTM